MPVSAEALSIDQLNLANFRNYERLRLEIGRRHVVLTGANGAGKTNLLEAVSLLAPGRGLRQAAFEGLVRRGTDAGWSISAEVDAGDSSFRWRRLISSLAKAANGPMRAAAASPSTAFLRRAVVGWDGTCAFSG